MSDNLAEKLRATTLSDGSGSGPGSGSEDWKKSLKLPARDTRQQTEVTCHCSFMPRTG
ncbi:hypothetical protein QBC47DRAFT_387541 [Echria macrotheca]|uniref:Uncharacterized protein n=1 Tax=Echria macrotheca TaxID=438768 RepID=A0AAJ0B7L1_9PEZI|nr:hypothetical protein QBC47DRAFT_387541 [Echria macrotheca]